jgi:hypothetical protein
MGSIGSKIRLIGCLVTTVAVLLCPEVSRADEGGASFWLPGQYASLAAAPQTPGWALAVSYYHSSVAAAGSVAAAREILTSRIPATVNVNLNLSLSGRADLVTLAPSYTFATPVLGGQLFVSMSGQYGRNASSLAGTLTALAGPIVATRTGMLQDSLTSYGDLAPIAALLWSHGVHNYAVYVTGNIPVGDYSPTRLVNIGLGHGAIDAGGAYTYQSAATGIEFSGVAGFTYNFKNSRYTVQRRHRFPLRLGRVALPHQAVLCRYCRVCLSGDHGRFRPESNPGALQVTCSRCWSADRI